MGMCTTLNPQTIYRLNVLKLPTTDSNNSLKPYIATKLHFLKSTQGDPTIYYISPIAGKSAISKVVLRSIGGKVRNVLLHILKSSGAWKYAQTKVVGQFPPHQMVLGNICNSTVEMKKVYNNNGEEGEINRRTPYGFGIPKTISVNSAGRI